jgi:hypothetical protein
MAQPGSPAPGWRGTIYTSGSDAAARNSERRKNVKRRESGDQIPRRSADSRRLSRFSHYAPPGANG